MKSLTRKLEPTRPRALATSSARVASRRLLASSVLRMPLVFGAKSDSTASKGPGATLSNCARASAASTSTTAVRTQASEKGRSGTTSTPTAKPPGPTAWAMTCRKPPGAAPRSSTRAPFTSR